MIRALTANGTATLADLQNILREIVVPQTCAPRPLPPFQIAITIRVPGDLEQLSDYFVATINRDRPVGWGFCAGDMCQALHSVIVFGWRKICPAG